MRKRNKAILFRLTEDEAQELDRRVRRSGLTREAYLRHLIRDRVPRESPPPDYYAMMRELHAIGVNLNQIARKAHTLQVIDASRYDEAVRLFAHTVEKITKAVVQPMEWKEGKTGKAQGGR